MSGEFGSMRHLGGRLVGSLWPGGPGGDGERWARSWLLAGEVRLWGRLSGPDRRHALGVARQVSRQLGIVVGDGPRRPIMAAALLHDVGKVDARLGTWSRVAVTAAAITVGRSRVAAWAGPGRTWPARAGRYVTHDRLGAELLVAAGSDPFTVAWAAEHHLPADRRSVAPAVAAVLEAADGD
ncbi:MAG: HD domain-containing protein [Actinomycetota bacterium]|nr:HD domain-containing protein [Actinomycetota bacterium]